MIFFFSGAEVARYSICERLAYKKGLQKLGTERQIRLQGRAFKNYFGPRRREFERSNLQKFKCLWFARVGAVSS